MVGGSLTEYALVEEPPKDKSEYDETYVILEDHLCPDGPIEEPSIRRVSKPPATEYQSVLRGTRTSDIRVYTLLHETMARDLVVCN